MKFLLTTFCTLLLTMFCAPTAGAYNQICQLLAAGNSPAQVADSYSVRQLLPQSDHGARMVFVRSTAAGQCPQFLWRF